jgi:tRNA/tmRNA/rRNA uracil-C5-methylase (TrmA/RlmC/RlmD family)
VSRRGPVQDLVGTRLELDVTAVAHGGHCVARHDNRVVFVRHALPGERVVATVTEGGRTSRFLRADAVEILIASPDRVEPPCPFSGPGRCGGCDWQHASLPAQRALKAAVVAEALQRLGGLDADAPVLNGLSVAELPGAPDGLRWRTRVRYTADRQGRLGFHRFHTHDVLPVDDCRIATAAVVGTGVTELPWPRADAVEVTAGSVPGQEPVVREIREGGTPRVVRGKTRVVEAAAGREWQVSPGGFWQVHPAAADTLVDAVLELVDAAGGVRPGDVVLDLYAGVGLFAGALAQRGPDATVVAVETAEAACRQARRNLHDLASARVVEARVDRWLRDESPDAAVVVLDPPRSGAGADVVRGIVAAGPRAVVYIACDPAALARDVKTFAEHGYGLTELRAFDLFPMTHHLECVALLTPAPAPAVD